MQSTKTPTKLSCDFCGQERPPIYIHVGNQDVKCGYEACTCSGAQAARDAETSHQNEQAKHVLEDSRRKRLKKAGIPERYLSANHDMSESMAKSVLEGRGFYIWGKGPGTGKTTLACAISRQCIEVGLSVKFEVVPVLMESMRSRSTENRDLTKKLSECRLLVLDDLGKESATPYALERLFAIVNDRYNNLRPVVITSNYSRSELANRCGESGNSIASRLTEMTRSIKLDGIDRRIS